MDKESINCDQSRWHLLEHEIRSFAIQYANESAKIKNRKLENKLVKLEFNKTFSTDQN